MVVLICLIFSVLSTIEEYAGFANETLFWMVGSMICRYIDEGLVGSGMGLFLIGGHWPKILPQNSKEANLRGWIG